MANDHFIPRFLTKPWEAPPQRSLRFYDFGTRSFGRESSRNLFATSDLNDAETEQRLNQWIETPVSQYLAGKRAGGTRTVLAEPPNWRVQRALARLWLFQTPRLAEARRRSAGLADPAPAPAGDESLAEALGRGERCLDELVAALTEASQVVVATIPAAEWLLFNDRGYFPVPVVGHEPIMALPLSTVHFVSVVPRSTPDDALQNAINPEFSRITALSVGPSKKVGKVVVPPDQYPAVDQNPAGFASMLELFRGGAARMC